MVNARIELIPIQDYRIKLDFELSAISKEDLMDDITFLS